MITSVCCALLMCFCSLFVAIHLKEGCRTLNSIYTDVHTSVYLRGREVVFVNTMSFFNNWRHVLGGRFVRRVLILAAVILALVSVRSLSESTMTVLIPPPPMKHDLDYYRRTRKLNEFNPIIEPSASPCEEEVLVLALVSSAPHRFKHRDVIRSTWGRELPTYFFLGLPSDQIDEQLVDIYVEAKEYGDIIVADFVDSYYNLTLKTALMLQWTLKSCSTADFLLKTDDDVLLNPWAMDMVIQDHAGAQLIGYKKNNTIPHRDPYSKWYLPRWLFPGDIITEYLSGTAYLINGSIVKEIYEAALKVPLINLEDVYLTYLVAKEHLGLNLTHDARMSPYRPYFSLTCGFWNLATSHSLTPDDIMSVWPKIKTRAENNQDGEPVCDFYTNYLHSEMLLYNPY